MGANLRPVHWCFDLLINLVEHCKSRVDTWWLSQADEHQVVKRPTWCFDEAVKFHHRGLKVFGVCQPASCAVLTHTGHKRGIFPTLFNFPMFTSAFWNGEEANWMPDKLHFLYLATQRFYCFLFDQSDLVKATNLCFRLCPCLKKNFPQIHQDGTFRADFSAIN